MARTATRAASARAATRGPAFRVRFRNEGTRRARCEAHSTRRRTAATNLNMVARRVARFQLDRTFGFPSAAFEADAARPRRVRVSRREVDATAPRRVPAAKQPSTRAAPVHEIGAHAPGPFTAAYPAPAAVVRHPPHARSRRRALPAPAGTTRHTATASSETPRAGPRFRPPAGHRRHVRK